jgi:tetratricopeptide (TPR) repeat protein
LLLPESTRSDGGPSYIPVAGRTGSWLSLLANSEQSTECLSARLHSLCLPPSSLKISAFGFLLRITPRTFRYTAKFSATLGDGLQARFTRLGNSSDLENAIVARRRAVELTLDEHPFQPYYLADLGASLYQRFELLDNAADLDDSITVHRKTVDLADASFSAGSRARFLSNLAYVLRARVNRLADLVDLEDAIVARRGAIDLALGDTMKAESLAELRELLQTRFERLGNALDLDSAVAAQREALALVAQNDHERRAGYLNDLSYSLAHRFGRFGHLADIDEAISAAREAVALTPRDHTHLPAYMKNLAAWLKWRFDHTLVYTDFADAVTALRHAVVLAPLGGHQRADYIGRLMDLEESAPLSARRRLGPSDDAIDMEEIIVPQRAAVHQLDDSHPKKIYRLHELGLSLRAQFRKLKDAADIDESVAVLRRAVELTPAGHPKKFYLFISLGESLDVRFHHLSTDTDYDEAINAFLAAAGQDAAAPSHRVRVARWCARLCWGKFHSRNADMIAYLLQVYEIALPLIPQAASLGSTMTQRFDELTDRDNIGRAAASIAIRTGQLARAVEWLEVGRGVVWNQVLQLRSPVDELHALYPDLAENLRRISRVLDGLSDNSQNQPAENPTAVSSKDAEQPRNRALLAEYQDVLGQIRALPGFAHFLQPKTLADFSLPHDGPVVMINIYERVGADALIVFAVDHIVRVPLPKLTDALAEKIYVNLSFALLQAGVRDRAMRQQEPRLSPYKKLMTWVLERLWTLAVEPVIQVIEKEVLCPLVLWPTAHAEDPVVKYNLAGQSSTCHLVRNWTAHVSTSSCSRNLQRTARHGTSAKSYRADCLFIYANIVRTFPPSRSSHT